MSNSIKDHNYFMQLTARLSNELRQLNAAKDSHRSMNLVSGGYEVSAYFKNRIVELDQQYQNTWENIYKYIDKHVEKEIEKAKSIEADHWLDLFKEYEASRKAHKEHSRDATIHATIYATKNACDNSPLEYHVPIELLSSLKLDFIRSQIIDEIHKMDNLTDTSWIWVARLFAISETYWKNGFGTVVFIFHFTACDGKLEEVSHTVESNGNQIHLNIKEIAKSLVSKIKSVNSAKHAPE